MKDSEKNIKLLIDANILLDVLMNRKPFARDSSIVWKLCESGRTKGCVSALTFANLVYVMRKEFTPERIEQVLKSLSLIFEFVDLTASDLLRAAEMKRDDFEDALQCVTAERIHADWIITRNEKDFFDNIVKALTPSEFLMMY